MKVPSSSENLLLYNAVHASVQELAMRASRGGVNPMALSMQPSGGTEETAVSLLLDSVLWLASQAPPVVDLTLPASCVEILVESMTNEECHGMLAYLDSRLMQFKSAALFPRSHLTLLRTCTLLMRRLSKSRDASLCGRVLLFLAKFLPLTERSGVNNLGLFHTENKTPIEDVAPDALDAEGNPIDKNFYYTFWSLQKWFADPPSALAPSKWAEASSALRKVLDVFSKEPVTVTEASRDGLIGMSMLDSFSKDDEFLKTSMEGVSLKYLSSARLLPLQLRDATFRRHILIQALILMHWVEKPFLKDYASKAAEDEQLDDIEDLRKKVYTALEATPEEGMKFAEAIRLLMEAEDAWAVWKQAGCPKAPLEIPPASPPEGIDDADVLPPFKRPRPSMECVFGIRVGTQELDRLWNLSEDNVSILAAEDRGGFKSLRDLMNPVIEEMKEAAEEGRQGDDGTRGGLTASSDAVYNWKALRVISRHSLAAFVASVRHGGNLDAAARILYPAEVPPEKRGDANSSKAEVVERERSAEEAMAAEAAPLTETAYKEGALGDIGNEGATSPSGRDRSVDAVDVEGEKRLIQENKSESQAVRVTRMAVDAGRRITPSSELESGMDLKKDEANNAIHEIGSGDNKNDAEQQKEGSGV